MTVNTLDQPRFALSSSAMPAWCTTAGGVLTFILGVPLARFQTEMPLPWWIPTLNAVSHLLLLVGVVEMWRAWVAGRGGMVTAGVWLTLFGLAELTVAEGISLVNMDIAIIFYSTATLILILGPILLGSAVMRAGRWAGWHRFTPLITGLFMLLVVLPALFLPGNISNFAIGGWGVCWLLVGVSQLAEG